MIFEQSCQACGGDMVRVREMCRVVFWCIGCGFNSGPVVQAGTYRSLAEESRSARLDVFDPEPVAAE